MKQTVEQLRQKMVDYIGYDSIYDIPLTNADGTENDILKKHKGKVTVLFNTTGHCGNSPQFDIMQQLYEEVKDLGVEFLAVPTNDYCGPGVTYGEFTDGIINAKASENFARSYHEVTFPFSEIQSSRNLSIWVAEGYKDEAPQVPRSPLYQFIIPNPSWEAMSGNFHKYIINQDGWPVASFHNGSFLFFRVTNEKDMNKNDLKTPWEEIQDFKSVLQEVIATKTTTNPDYVYDVINKYKDFLSTL